MTIHQERTHEVFVAGCFACRVSSIQLGAGTRDTRTEHKPGERKFMNGFAREFENGDREAYVRLRRNGLQPPRIAGSGHLERHAETPYEVESGQIMADQKALKTVMTMCDDGGFDPLTPAVQPKGE